jgi:hypothetical protein
MFSQWSYHFKGKGCYRINLYFVVYSARFAIDLYLNTSSHMHSNDYPLHFFPYM